MSSTLATAAQPLPIPTVSDVIALQAMRTVPAVSVLLSTAPQPAMDAKSAARLDQLLADAARRLRCQAPGEVAEDLVAALHALAVAARASRTRLGVALYAAPGVSCWFSLPVSVSEGVVVDATFATRDLLRALPCTPRHALLHLFRTAGPVV